MKTTLYSKTLVGGDVAVVSRKREAREGLFHKIPVFVRRLFAKYST